MFYKAQKRFMVVGMMFLLAIASNAATGCQQSGHNGVDNEESAHSITFTDDMGREVTVNNPQKVVCLTSSFADIWHLAGGTEQIAATTNATWKYYDIPLGEDVVNLGSSKEINLEQLIACEPDLVLASCGTDRNVELESLLTEMNITTAYFSVDTIDDYLRMLDVCTQITGCEENYEKYGIDVKTHVEQTINRAERAVEAAKTGCKYANEEAESNQQAAEEVNEEAENNQQAAKDANVEVESNQQDVKDANEEAENNQQAAKDVNEEAESNQQDAKDANEEAESNQQDTKDANEEAESNQQDAEVTNKPAESNRQDVKDTNKPEGSKPQNSKQANKYAPTVLYIRATGSSCKVKNSKDSILGEMLSDLGCINIADSESSLLEQLSMEVILEQDPEYIFVILQNADTSDEILESTLLSNPAWASLSAVKEGRYHVLDTTLYNMKPNARWGEAYEKLADILYPEQ